MTKEVILLADIEIKGLDILNAKLKKLPELFRNAIENGVEDSADKAQGYAQRELASSVKSSETNLSRSLKTEIVKNSDAGYITARLFSDSKIWAYREFGTGLNGQNSPKDLPEGFVPMYKQGPWLIPEAKSGDLTMYGMKRIKIGDSYWYPSNGQIARPFIMPAVKKVSKEMDDLIGNRINTALHNKLGG